MTRVTVGRAAVVVCAWLAGCAGGVADFDPVPRFGLYPADGAMALQGPVEIQVSLGPDQIGLLPEVTVHDDDARRVADCALSEDGLTATCDAGGALPEDGDWLVEVTVGDTATVAWLSGRVPEPGEAYLLSEPTVERFGDTESGAELLAAQMENEEWVMVLSDQPEGLRLLGGAATDPRDDTTTIEAPGLTFVLPATLGADGALVAGPGDAWLTIGGAPIRLEDCVVTGTPTAEGMTLALEASVPGDALAALADAEGVPLALLRTQVSLDVDRDGDGDRDAAALVFSGPAPEVLLRSWDR